MIAKSIGKGLWGAYSAFCFSRVRQTEVLTSSLSLSSAVACFATSVRSSQRQYSDNIRVGKATDARCKVWALRVGVVSEC
eukprot:scaffold771_cov387-Prasinococcus_capsulatus_cf.AAC.20